MKFSWGQRNTKRLKLHLNGIWTRCGPSMLVHGQNHLNKVKGLDPVKRNPVTDHDIDRCGVQDGHSKEVSAEMQRQA